MSSQRARLRRAGRILAQAALCAALAVPVLAQQPVDWTAKPLQSERSRAYDALHYRIAIRRDRAVTVFLALLPMVGAVAMIVAEVAGLG